VLTGRPYGRAGTRCATLAPGDGPDAKERTLPAIDRAALSAAAVGAVPSTLAALTGHRRAAAALLALPLGIAAFFRDPDRAPDGPGAEVASPDLAVAPADGRVMYAGPVQDGVGPDGSWLQVSIFLSLFDVHINRAPYGGVVRAVSYRPGRWHAAYKFESATENERSEITVVDEATGRTVVFRQIVGLVARRVVTRVGAGDRIGTGQRIGLMKFGSRMDVFLPLDAVLTVAAGDRAVAGETVIARWPGTAP
jgi:phosphatidylserine decarboxylase